MKSCLLQFVIALTSNNFSFLCGLYEGDPVEQAIRKWKCLLFHLFRTDYPAEGAQHRHTASHGAGYHCLASQYFPRNDGLGGSTLHQEILRSSGSHFGSRNRFGRYPAGVHQSLFRQGCHSTGHLAWDTD